MNIPQRKMINFLIFFTAGSVAFLSFGGRIVSGTATAMMVTSTSAPGWVCPCPCPRLWL